MIVKFKKLHPDAVTPTRAHPTDAGLDLTCVSVNYENGDIVNYSTGLAMEIPDGYCGLIFPRSSIYKQDLQLSNSVGLIDSSYRGEILLKFRTVQPFAKRYKVGERVGQIVIIPYPEIEFEEADELSESDRGTGGYGSSGK